MISGVVANPQSQSLFHVRDSLMDVKRRTKIIVSLGPATDNAKVMAALVQEGIDVARINMSHGSPEDHRRRAALLRKCTQEQNRSVGLLVDLHNYILQFCCFTYESGSDDTYLCFLHNRNPQSCNQEFPTIAK